MAETIPLTAPNSSGSEPPRYPAPENATDCHIHIFDPRFQPPASNPVNGTASDYRLLQKRLGLTRVVVVTPRHYGTDNSVTVDAIAQLGKQARGVAVLHPSVTDTELKRLHQGGIRALRFTLGRPEAAIVSVDMIEPLSKRVADLGWHLQLSMETDQLVANADMLMRLPTPLVFDHLASLPIAGTFDDPAYNVIGKLIDSGRTWLKVCFSFLLGKQEPRGVEGVTAMVRAFIQSAPERLLWGTDWPHLAVRLKPDDAAMLDMLAICAPDVATRNRILVANPNALYGFSSDA